MKRRPAIEELLRVMAKLRSPTGCPWDRQQTHRSLRRHAIEEVYELIDAIEAGDDHEMVEELGDLLLQVVFHCQLARERGAFDFDTVCRRLVEKLVRRHPHVFGKVRVRNVDQVWANWEKIKHAEKHGTPRARDSALDGIPKHLPALLRAEKLVKKARKAALLSGSRARWRGGKVALARRLFELAAVAQARGWSAEELLAAEIRKQERRLREVEARKRFSPQISKPPRSTRASAR
ncbi:MAG: MazG family protein [Verrucomicrobiae bacterium]|nr:MazG family protein [Verrucomicrobiae bacterium]